MKGHWSGDAECPKNKGARSTAAAPKKEFAPKILRGRARTRSRNGEHAVGNTDAALDCHKVAIAERANENALTKVSFDNAFEYQKGGKADYLKFQTFVTPRLGLRQDHAWLRLGITVRGRAEEFGDEVRDPRQQADLQPIAIEGIEGKLYSSEAPGALPLLLSKAERALGAVRSTPLGPQV